MIVHRALLNGRPNGGFGRCRLTATGEADRAQAGEQDGADNEGEQELFDVETLPRPRPLPVSCTRQQGLYGLIVGAIESEDPAHAVQVIVQDSAEVGAGRLRLVCRFQQTTTCCMQHV